MARWKRISSEGKARFVFRTALGFSLFMICVLNPFRDSWESVIRSSIILVTGGVVIGLIDLWLRPKEF